MVALAERKGEIHALTRSSALGASEGRTIGAFREQQGVDAWREVTLRGDEMPEEKPRPTLMAVKREPASLRALLTAVKPPTTRFVKIL